MSDERYEIRGKIGQGGVGAVYRAFDRNLNREVAIKRVLTEGGFDPKNSEDEATKALLKEATALCSVQHPHIVTVYDAGVDNDGPYVVMELLSGRTLDEMIERGTMTWGDFRETAVQSLEALIAAQELNLVHRDIKPSNVMVTWLPSGKFQVKLVDFGLAKFSAKPSLQTIDHGDAVFGSIHFMAPEQFERTHLDQRTDMYSLGCVFFFCLTGHYPFDGDSAPLVMAAHLQNSFTPLSSYRPDIPDWVCQWVEWHLARELDDRPRDAREALERFLSFEAPVNSGTVPVHVKAIPASSLMVAPSSAPTDGVEVSTPRVTGPVPVHATAPTPVASLAESTSFSQLLMGGIVESHPQTSDPMSSNEENNTPKTVPLAITPPEGAKPSVHTGAQIVRATTGPVPYHSQPVPAPAPAQPAVVAQALPPGISPPKLAQPVPSTVISAAPPTTEAGPRGTEPAVVIPATGLRSTAAKATIAVLLTLAIAFASWFLVDRVQTNKRNQALQDLLNKAANPTAATVPMNREQVDQLLGVAGSSSFNKDKLAVYQALYLASSTDDVDIDQRIARYAAKQDLNEEVRVKFFQVLEKRGNDSGVSTLIEYAAESNEERSVVAALTAVSKNLRERDLQELYKLISFSDSPEVQGAAERAVKTYAIAQDNTTIITRDLAKAYKAASESRARQAYLRLLGATGNERAVDTLKDALESKDESLKVAAYSAFGSWRDDSLFEEHLAGMASESTKFVRAHAFDSMLTFLLGDLDVTRDREQEMWELFSKEVQDDREKREFISKIARSSTDWRIELVRPYLTDPNEEISFLAEKAVESLNRRKES